MESGSLFLLFVIIAGAIFTFGFIFVIIGSLKRKGRFGTNFKTVYCPNCRLIMPRIRIPKSVYEALWGGWTCEGCGTKMDKWGKER